MSSTIQNRYNPTGQLGLYITLLITAYFIIHTFGLNFISGNSAYWNKEVGDLDLVQHNSGINMFISSPWRFPLLYFNNLNYPQGTYVTFTDSIPVFSIILKIFSPRNIEYTNFLGYWVGLCFLLQGVAAWWITKELEIKSWFFLLFLLSIFLSFPALMTRLKHVALMSHWIILFAFALYLRGNRLGRLPNKGWISLLCLAFYIHIYIFVMAVGIYLATLLETKGKMTWSSFILALLPFVILGLSLFIFLMPFPYEHLNTEEGFNENGMSLFSPLFGGNLVHWQIDITRGQREEGFNYLGLGIISAFLLTTFCWPRKCRTLIKKHWPMFTTMFFYFIYSHSDHIFLGQRLIAIINYPHCLDFITGQLRCSGRFFWPVGYAIIIFSSYILYQTLSKRYFIISICILALVQFLDTNEIYKKLKAAKHTNPTKIIDYAALDEVIGSEVKYIFFYPKFKCGAKRWQSNILLPITKYVASRHFTINTGYIARYTPNCKNTKEEIRQSDHTKSAYIFAKSDFYRAQDALNLMANLHQKASCQEFNLFFICKFKQPLIENRQ